MNIYNQIKSEINVSLEELKAEGFLPADVSFDSVDAMPTKDASHGDIATNAAMVLAGKTGKKPREIAEKLVGKLKQSKMAHNSPLVGESKFTSSAGAPEISVGGSVNTAASGFTRPPPAPAGAGAALPPGEGCFLFTAIDIAGPGFINFTLKPAMWQAQIADILREGIGYGNSTAGKNRRVNIEYVSANPTGPMHVGHGRGAVVGDALALLLMKAGFAVTKEYYINDAGSQIGVLAESAYLRYREALGEGIGEIPKGLYPGEYLKLVGQGLAQYYGQELLKKPSDERMLLVRRYTIDAMMEMIKEDLRIMGIQHDVFSSEQAIRDAGKVDEVVQVLEKNGLLYTGVLEPPKGKPPPEDWEPRPQLLFKASQFGDDSDRAIKKSDGTWAYMTPDIAYHLDKYQRGFNDMIVVLGADHAGYVKRLSAAVKALSNNQARVDVKLCQMVKFMRNGEPEKMSKRAGTFMTVRDVVDEVGNGVFRFIMLTRKNDMPLDFDFAKVMEQSKDNPVFYVQYAHARAKSVLRMALEQMPDAVKLSEQSTVELLARLSSTAELEVIKILAQWPRMVESAALAHEPHRIAFYVQEVAAAFHGLWNKGNEDPSLKFLVKDDLHLTAARLALVRAMATVVASSLWVLGVEPVEQM